MVVDTLGDLIATLGSIDHDEIDWPNIRQATVLIHQTFRYDYPGPITDLRQRLMVVPPDYHGHQRLTTHKLRVSGCNVECERSYDSFGNVVLDLTLEEVDGHVEFVTWALVECHVPIDGGEAPDDVGMDRRFGEPSRLTKPDAKLRAVAAELRASGATGLDLAALVCTPRARSLRLRVGRHERRDDRGGGLGRRPGRLPGLRPLHGRALQAVRSACPLRLGPPPRRRRDARLGRGARAGRGRDRDGRALRPHARSTCRAALRHGRRRPRLRRRAADVGDVRGAVPRRADHAQDARRSCASSTCSRRAGGASPGARAPAPP